MNPPEGRPFPVGRRGLLLLLALPLAAASVWALDLSLAQLWPHAGGRRLALEFFQAAVQPAFDYQHPVPSGTPAFLSRLGQAIYRTVLFAAAAMSVALVAGFFLGLLASQSWWRTSGHALGRRRGWGKVWRGICFAAVRLLIALLRSIHELLWAVIFLAAFGLHPATAILAIALPYTGTLAKIFSEMLDEAPTGSAAALQALGAPPAWVFGFGLLPRALPDMAAYAFYRFECAIRSAAVMGFFGIPTLGMYLKASFDNLHFREVWTYLYALFLVVVLLEVWSWKLRRALVA
ncbi:MAG: ABC transporter permease subunit [Planctomycetota bacterium]|nr:MAG: ABC transporter permease subunit [Planctomycetota bacterium]